MATITDPALSRVINERIRPDVESIYGLRMLGLDDAQALDTVLANIPADGTVLDGSDVSAVTGQMLHDYRGLLGDLLAATSDPNVLGSLQAAKVRPLDVIIGNLSHPPEASGDAVRDAINQRMRPRCRAIRALRYQFANHLNVIPGLLTPYQSADVIDDGRVAEGVAPLTVGAVQVLLAFMAAATAPSVNTAARALAVDYGAGTPLEIRY